MTTFYTIPMNGPQPRKKGKKRKAESGEHSADAEDAPKQSAGISNILKRFRSTHRDPNELRGQDADLGQDAAAAPSGLELGDAELQNEENIAEGADDAAPVRNTSEDAHETAGQLQHSSAQLPASQSRPDDVAADEAEEEDNDRGKHKAKQKQPKQASDAVLPWMRLPVSITAGQGVQLGDVGGLDPAPQRQDARRSADQRHPSHSFSCACREHVPAMSVCCLSVNSLHVKFA